MNFDIIELNINDNNYPENLRLIKNPPQKLYVLGNVSSLSEVGMAIIGSRSCSDVGRDNARKFSYSLSKLGFVIISGMALGIDTAAHLGALDAGGKTIAVLGSGFNNIFPKENKKLFQRIIENGGTIVSEYLPNVEPSSEKFVQRNRIVSGLSSGVLIIEAKWRSGTSITASFAKSQNKTIFCIAHGIDDNTGEGTNRLIKQGAKLVTEVADIIKEFDFVEHKKIDKTTIQPEIPEEYLKIYRKHILNDGLDLTRFLDSMFKNDKKDGEEINVK